MSQTQLWTDRSRWPSAPPLTATTLTVRSNCGKSSFKTPGFHVMKKNASNDGAPREGWMSRALFLGTLLLAGPFLGMSCAQNSWAQNKTEPTQTAPPFPFTKTIFRWDYSCPAGIACTVVCPGGEVNHVLKFCTWERYSTMAAKALRLCSTK